MKKSKPVVLVILAMILYVVGGAVTIALARNTVPCQIAGPSCGEAEGLVGIMWPIFLPFLSMIYLANLWSGR